MNAWLALGLSSGHKISVLSLPFYDILTPPVPVEDIRVAGVGAAGGDVAGGSAAKRCMGIRRAREV